MEKIRLWKGKPPFFNEDFQNDENREAPCVTPYIVNDGSVHPCIVVVPGGGYSHRALHEGEPIARWLNDKGINAFVVDYRVEPYMYPAPVIDVKRAVRYVRFYAERFAVDPERIGIIGFSAGAHAACCASLYFEDFEYDEKDDIDMICARPDICALCYPVITFKDGFCHEGSRERLIGRDRSLISKLSCEENVSENMPPVFMWHTFEDQSVPVRNSLEMALALKKHEVPFELHIFPNGRHGLGMERCVDIEGVNKWPDLFLNWLRRMNF